MPPEGPVVVQPEVVVIGPVRGVRHAVGHALGVADIHVYVVVLVILAHVTLHAVGDMAVHVVEVIEVVGEFGRERKTFGHQRGEVPRQIERSLQRVDELFGIAALRGERPRVEVYGRSCAAGRAIGILAGHLDRRHLTHLREYFVGCGSRIGLVLDDSAQPEAQNEVFRHIDIDVRTEIVTVGARIGAVVVAGIFAEQSALAGVAHIDEVTNDFVSSADTQVVDRLKAILLQYVAHPIRIGIEIRVGTVAELQQLLLRPRQGGRRAAPVACRLVHERSEFVTGDILRETQPVQRGELRPEYDLRFPHPTFLGVDENDAVGAADAVYRRCGGVLEHCHRLDLSHVDQVHVALHAVHEDQRIAVLPRTHAPDEDRCRVVARLARALTRDDARHRAADGVRQRHGRRPFEYLGFHAGQGAGHRLFFLRAVSHDHDVLHFGRSLAHHDILYRLSLIDDLFGLVSQETEHDRCTGHQSVHFVVSVESGGGSPGCILHDDGYADHRPALYVEYQTRYSLCLLGPGRRQTAYGQQESRQRSFGALQENVEKIHRRLDFGRSARRWDEAPGGASPPSRRTRISI